MQLGSWHKREGEEESGQLSGGFTLIKHTQSNPGRPDLKKGHYTKSFLFTLTLGGEGKHTAVERNVTFLSFYISEKDKLL